MSNKYVELLRRDETTTLKANTINLVVQGYVHLWRTINSPKSKSNKNYLLFQTS